MWLVTIIGGAAIPASDLARIAGLAPSTATSHLRRLEAAGLVVVCPRGRHQYFSLSGSHVAHAVESQTVRRAAGTHGPERRGAPKTRTPRARMLRPLGRTTQWHRCPDERASRSSRKRIAVLLDGRDRS
jgi:DNA-binding IclR family transcriptional regulator